MGLPRCRTPRHLHRRRAEEPAHCARACLRSLPRHTRVQCPHDGGRCPMVWHTASHAAAVQIQDVLAHGSFDPQRRATEVARRPASSQGTHRQQRRGVRRHGCETRQRLCLPRPSRDWPTQRASPHSVRESMEQCALRHEEVGTRLGRSVREGVGSMGQGRGRRHLVEPSSSAQ
jgi:hypothetical protein